MGCGFQPHSASDVHDARGVDAPRVDEDAPKVYMDAALCPDDDHDGICNAVDDWPCGAKPTAPSSSIELTDNGGSTDFKLTSINIAGQATLPVVQHGTTVRMQLHYVVKDSACPQACQDQLEVGWHPPGTRLGCVFDFAIPNDGNSYVGDISDTSFAAPTTPGSYELRIHIGQKNFCDMAGNSWYGGSEPIDGVIAQLCVQ